MSKTALLIIFLACSIPHFPAFATVYYVDVTGDDIANSGLDPGDPFQTITHATVVASEEDTIYVAAGLYDSTVNGETFPLHIKPGIKLIGDGPSTTVINDDDDTDNSVHDMMTIDILVNQGEDHSETLIEGFLIEGNGLVENLFGVRIFTIDTEAGVTPTVRGTVIQNYEQAGLLTLTYANTWQASTTALIEENVFINTNIGYISHPQAASAVPYQASDFSVIRNNYFTALDSGCFLETGNEWTGEFVNVSIVNNTFDSILSDGIAMIAEQGVSGRTEALIANNIFSGCELSAIFQNDADSEPAALAANLFYVDRNLLPEAVYYESVALYNNCSTINLFPFSSRAYPNLCDYDPLFLGPGDYHVDEYSPALDNGAPPVFDGSIPEIDLDGEERPVDDTWDIGADETLMGPPPDEISDLSKEETPLLLAKDPLERSLIMEWEDASAELSPRTGRYHVYRGRIEAFRGLLNFPYYYDHTCHDEAAEVVPIVTNGTTLIDELLDRIPRYYLITAANSLRAIAAPGKNSNRIPTPHPDEISRLNCP